MGKFLSNLNLTTKILFTILTIAFGLSQYCRLKTANEQKKLEKEFSQYRKGVEAENKKSMERYGEYEARIRNYNSTIDETRSEIEELSISIKKEKLRSAKELKEADVSRDELFEEYENQSNIIGGLKLSVGKLNRTVLIYSKLVTEKDKQIEILNVMILKQKITIEKYTNLYTSLKSVKKGYKWFSVSVGGLYTTSGTLGVGVSVGITIFRF
jgi:TolA-binding protein